MVEESRQWLGKWYLVRAEAVGSLNARAQFVEFILKFISCYNGS